MSLVHGKSSFEFFACVGTINRPRQKEHARASKFVAIDHKQLMINRGKARFMGSFLLLSHLHGHHESSRQNHDARASKSVAAGQKLLGIKRSTVRFTGSKMVHCDESARRWRPLPDFRAARRHRRADILCSRFEVPDAVETPSRSAGRPRLTFKVDLHLKTLGCADAKPVLPNVALTGPVTTVAGLLPLLQNFKDRESLASP